MNHDMYYKKLWLNLKNKLQALVEDCPPIEEFEFYAAGYNEVLKYIQAEEGFYTAVEKAVDETLKSKP